MTKYRNENGEMVEMTIEEVRCLKIIRLYTPYCKDVYFMPDVRKAIASGNYWQWLQDNMCSICINAAATDSSYHNG